MGTSRRDPPCSAGGGDGANGARARARRAPNRADRAGPSGSVLAARRTSTPAGLDVALDPHRWRRPARDPDHGSPWAKYRSAAPSSAPGHCRLRFGIGGRVWLRRARPSSRPRASLNDHAPEWSYKSYDKRNAVIPAKCISSWQQHFGALKIADPSTNSASPTIPADQISKVRHPTPPKACPGAPCFGGSLVDRRITKKRSAGTVGLEKLSQMNPTYVGRRACGPD